MQVETDYKLLNNGKVTRVDPNDGSENDASDTLYATNTDGSVNKKKSVTVQKEKSSDSSVIGDLATNVSNSDGKSFPDGIRSASTSNKSDAFEVYSFVAKNSNVEWGMLGFLDKKWSFTIYTGHNESLTPGQASVKADLFNLEFDIHSHKNRNSVSFQELTFNNNRDDIDYAASVTTSKRRLGSNRVPQFFVLYAPSDSKSSMHLHKYWGDVTKSGQVGGGQKSLGPVKKLNLNQVSW